jgi:alkyl sulfatase BDS1-like metallo-beta-lactamase superfamily hydrolase
VSAAPHAWSHYLGETIERWGAKTDVLYGMHHWPVWGSERAIDLLSKGRDAYGFINDETLRLANHGYNPGRDQRDGQATRPPGPSPLTRPVSVWLTGPRSRPAV